MVPNGNAKNSATITSSSMKAISARMKATMISTIDTISVATPWARPWNRSGSTRLAPMSSTVYIRTPSTRAR